MDASIKQLTVLDQINASGAVRKKIIDAASLLYAKKGFMATSIEEISERAFQKDRCRFDGLQHHDDGAHVGPQEMAFS